MAWNWAKVGLLVVASGALPLASAKMALYESTMACTLAVVSASTPLTGPLSSALLMAARFAASTPLTPALA